MVVRAWSERNVSQWRVCKERKQQTNHLYFDWLITSNHENTLFLQACWLIVEVAVKDAFSHKHPHLFLFDIFPFLLLYFVAPHLTLIPIHFIYYSSSVFSIFSYPIPLLGLRSNSPYEENTHLGIADFDFSGKIGDWVFEVFGFSRKIRKWVVEIWFLSEVFESVMSQFHLGIADFCFWCKI